MGVIEYVTEEVERQGHDTTTLDGIQRVGWMLNAWSYALKRSETDVFPSTVDAVKLGSLIEAEKNVNGIRTCGVRVGFQSTPHPNNVPAMLSRLFENIRGADPIQFYKAFEEIHPFEDGNGRTGKVILNWLNGSLMKPIFPPADLWGRSIRNP